MTRLTNRPATRRSALAALALTATLVLSGCTGDGEASADAADVMFAQMMIPHHEQAVEMSALILDTEDVDPRVTALAEQIEAAQAPEIEQMTGMLENWGADLDRGMDHAGHGMAGMLDDDEIAALADADGPEAQRLFLEGMTVHHEGAIAMAEDVLADGSDPEVAALAREIVEAQKAEIATMRELLAEL